MIHPLFWKTIKPLVIPSGEKWEIVPRVLGEEVPEDAYMQPESVENAALYQQPEGVGNDYYLAPLPG